MRFVVEDSGSGIPAASREFVMQPFFTTKANSNNTGGMGLGVDRLVMNLLDLDRLARGIVEPKRRLADVGELVRGILTESELVPIERLQ